MLKADYTLTHVPVGREHVVFLHQSINQPVMNFPQGGSQPTGAYLLGIRHPAHNNVHTVFLYLHQPSTGGVILYVSEPRGLTREQLLVEEQEALHFVESMGFLVDNLNFGHLSRLEQDSIMARVPVFRPPPTTLDLVDVAQSTQSLPASGSVASFEAAGTLSGSPGPSATPLKGRIVTPTPDLPGAVVDTLELEGLVLVDRAALSAAAEAAAVPAGAVGMGSGEGTDRFSSLARLGRLLGTFLVPLLLLVHDASCRSFSSSTDEDHPSAENHLGLGNQQLSQGHWPDAIRAFSVVLDSDPNDREALWGMGVAYWKLDRRDKAEAYLRKAIAADPKWSVPKNELAGVLMDEHRCDEAEVLLREVLDDIFYPYPEFAEHNLASAMACNGHRAEALEQLDKLVVKRPHFCLGYLTMAQLSAQEKKPEMTIRACDGFENNCENNEEIRQQILPEQSAMCYFRKGLAYVELGDVESARTAFMRCQSDGTFGTECLRSLQMLPP